MSSFGNEDTEEQEENATLRQKLKNASEDLQRLMGEREKLFEVSNNLKSELSRVENESKANSQNIVTAVSEAEKETSRKYEHKVSTIEARLAELAAHNKALTGELSKWSAAGKNSIFSQGVMDDDDDFGPRVSVDIASDNINLDDSVDWSITQSQEFHQFAPDEDESSIADAVRNKMKLLSTLHPTTFKLDPKVQAHVEAYAAAAVCPTSTYMTYLLCTMAMVAGYSKVRALERFVVPVAAWALIVAEPGANKTQAYKVPEHRWGPCVHACAHRLSSMWS